MREVLGGEPQEDEAFAVYLSDWRNILAHRVEEAIAAFREINGLHGLILAGSNGIGNPWPLSDIDLIPVLDEDQAVEANAEIETLRGVLANGWSGWRTGVDSGRLWIGRTELKAFGSGQNPDPVPYLEDFRWYHTIDKAFGGKAVIDPDGNVSRLVAWLTEKRFDSAVVGFRRNHERSECLGSLRIAEENWIAGSRGMAWASLLKAIQWLQIFLLEGWGLRDNSLGTLGTRFERAAVEHGMGELVQELNAISRLNPARLTRRWDGAPDWPRERSDRSWRARIAVGEAVTKLQNDQDVMRVCTIYGLRSIEEEAETSWLAIPENDQTWQTQLAQLRGAIVEAGLDDPPVRGE